ncbi:MarC family protein [Vibrio sp. T187]|uniref:MarC family protein n=1 Tax=Vibrio TaxID=662 RepID=UPI0010C9EAC1|nr:MULTISPECIES: MarC family protein [Vibrio]MBW3698619.1 MarC family protein [Vibrio sp. T187]
MLTLFVTQFIMLWAVVDPVGSVPIYLTQTKPLSESQSRQLAVKAVGFAFGVLLFFLLVGQVLLETMNISLPVFQAAGGLVLLLFSLTMIFGESKPEQEQKLVEEELCRSRLADLAVYPLAMPSIASPGAMMAVVMLTDNYRFSFFEQLITGVVLVIVMGATLLLLLGAKKVHKVIGNAGAQIISRVMGLILSAVALNNLLNGLAGFVVEHSR